MNLYLITFQSSLNRIESVYDCHKDLFVEIEKFFTLHLVPYTEAASIPADAYRMAFIASGGVEKMVTQHFELLPYPIYQLSHHIGDSAMNNMYFHSFAAYPCSYFQGSSQ